jgi:hypothetical protein
VLEHAVFRGGKHNFYDLTTSTAMGIGRRPWLAPIALVNRAGFGSPLSQGMYRAGKALSRTNPQVTANTVRAAILALLDDESP